MYLKYFFEMVDEHLIFLVTIPIHDGSNESSEKSLETTAISSGTGNIHTTRNKRRNIYKFDLSAIFARKLQKSHLKMG